MRYAKYTLETGYQPLPSCLRGQPKRRERIAQWLRQLFGRPPQGQDRIEPGFLPGPISQNFPPNKKWTA